MYNTRHTRKYVSLKKNNQVWDYISDIKNEYRAGWGGYFMLFFYDLYNVFSNKFYIFAK